MSLVAEQITAVIKKIPDDVTLVAVSKTHPVERIIEAYHSGQRDFGENKVQELLEKVPKLPQDIRWHLIGHLQTNKVKYIAPFIHLIHAVDSMKLLEEINKQAEKNNRIIDCLLQLRIAQEETKFGMTKPNVEELASAHQHFKFVRICGLMGMATFTEDSAQISVEFNQLKQTFEVLKSAYFEQHSYFKTVSMGMSSDYQIAIQSGSNMVRIGSEIFGTRNYAE